jgi:AcrR family transcriptional regulator
MTPSTSDDGSSGARAQILEAAAQLVAERDTTGITAEDLAARAGVAPAVVTRCFATMEALFEELVRTTLPPLIDRVVAAILGQGSLTARLEGAIDVWIGDIRRRPTLVRLLTHRTSDGLVEPRPEVLAEVAETMTKVAAAISARANPAYANVDTSYVLNLLTGASVFYLPARLLEVHGTVGEPELLAYRRELLRVAHDSIEAATTPPDS